MSETHVIVSEPDFDEAMKSLAAEAEHHLDGRDSSTGHSRFVLALKTLASCVHTFGRTVAENTQAIEQMREQVAPQNTSPVLFETMRENVAEKNLLNQKLFDTLHEELRTYKDGFLLEIMHRPIASDLITLFDDLSVLHRQTEAFLTQHEGEESNEFSEVKVFNTNLSHAIHGLLEILARIRVERAEPSPGKLDKQKQRAVSVQLADTPEEDQQIVASVKPGFLWHERLLRPEEVIIKKWKEGMLTALSSSEK